MFRKPSLSIDDLAQDIEDLVSRNPMTALELSKRLSVPLDTIYRAINRIQPELKIVNRKYTV